MKIEKIRIQHVSIPLMGMLKTAQQERRESSNIFLRVEFDNGLFGYGEAAPREYVTGESEKSVFEVIEHQFFPNLKGVQIRTLADIKDTLFKLNSLLEVYDGIYHGAALCAIDLALLDGLGKMMEKPLHFLMGEPRRLAIEYSLGFPYVEKPDLDKAFAFLDKYSPKSLKIKMGRSQSEDLDRINFVRAHVGNNMELRVDANCQWDYETAYRMAYKLEKLGVVALEQPLPKHDIKDLKRLRKNIPMKIIADESACTIEDIKKLIDEDACDSFVIKLSKCGGLLNSLEQARYIEKHNKNCILGAHVGESGILEAAGRVFAALTQNCAYYETSGSSILFEEMVIEGFTGMDRECIGTLGNSAGLGVSVNEPIAKKYALSETLLN